LSNGYLYAEGFEEYGPKRAGDADMLKKLKELYKEYKPYVRVDLIMYAALILMIFLYFIISAILE